MVILIPCCDQFHNELLVWQLPSLLHLFVYPCRVTCRNALLNDSDGWYCVSLTSFHCQYCCASLCVQLVMYYAKWNKPLEWILAYFASLFYFTKEFNNLKMLFCVSTSSKLNKHLCKKSAWIFPYHPPFRWLAFGGKIASNTGKTLVQCFLMTILWYLVILWYQ